MRRKKENSLKNPEDVERLVRKFRALASKAMPPIPAVDVDDIVNDALVKVIQRQGKFLGDRAKFDTWACSILKWEIKTYSTEQRRNREQSGADDLFSTVGGLDDVAFDFPQNRRRGRKKLDCVIAELLKALVEHLPHVAERCQRLPRLLHGMRRRDIEYLTSYVRCNCSTAEFARYKRVSKRAVEKRIAAIVAAIDVRQYDYQWGLVDVSDFCVGVRYMIDCGICRIDATHYIDYLGRTATGSARFTIRIQFSIYIRIKLDIPVLHKPLNLTHEAHLAKPISSEATSSLHPSSLVQPTGLQLQRPCELAVVSSTRQSGRADQNASSDHMLTAKSNYGSAVLWVSVVGRGTLEGKWRDNLDDIPTWEYAHSTVEFRYASKTESVGRFAIPSGFRIQVPVSKGSPQRSAQLRLPSSPQ